MPKLAKLIVSVLLLLMPMHLFANPAMVPIISYLLSDSSSTPPPIGDTTPPEFTSNDLVDVNENTTTVITVRTNETATYALGGTDAGEFNLVGNALSFKDAPNYEVDAKTYSVTITATDSSANEATQTITISVLDVNDAPVATLTNISGEEDEWLLFDATYSDDDDDMITWHLETQPSSGTVELDYDGKNDSTSVYKPNADFHGADSFSYKVCDDSGESNACSEIVEVSIVISTTTNAHPVATLSTFEMTEDTIASSFLTVDDDSSSFTYELVSDGQLLRGYATLDNNSTGAFTFRPHENYFGVTYFSYKVYDGEYWSEIKQVEVTILGVEDSPLGSNRSGKNTNEDETSWIDVQATDGDVFPGSPASATCHFTTPQNGTLSSSTSPSNGSFCAVKYTPNENWNGTDTYTYTIDDGSEVVGPYTVSIIVHPVDDLPVFTTTEMYVNEKEAFDITIEISDLEGDNYTIHYDGDGDDNSANDIPGITTDNSEVNKIRITSSPLGDYEQHEEAYVFHLRTTESSIDYKIYLIDIYTELYLSDAYYDNQMTSDVNDDILYLYKTGHTLDPETISDDSSANYTVIGDGAIGTASTQEWDSSLSRHKIHLNSDGSISEVFNDTSKIKYAPDTIKSTSGLINEGGESGAVFSSVIHMKKTGQTISYATGDDGDTQTGLESAYSNVLYNAGTRVDPDPENSIKDKFTNLIWQNQKIPKSAYNGSRCYSLTYGGSSDWRLPTVSELFTLMSYDKSGIKLDVLFNNEDSNALYWTRDEYADDTDKQIAVSFVHAQSIALVKTLSLVQTRCVR